MTTVPEFCMPSKTSPILQSRSARAVVARIIGLLLVLAGIGSYAGAQSLGFVVNSTDGTVTVLANATTTLDAQAFSEDTMQTVTFPTQAGQSAVQLVATAVAPAAGSKTPPARLVYVTDQKNNELWAFDISTISQGNAAAKPVNITAGSCSPLFNKPGAIVIATPGSSIFAYVANQGDGTVSIINLSTSSCVAKTAALGTITAMAASPDGNEVFILTSTVGALAALWEIPTSTQTAAQVNAAAVKLANPVSINVQNDAAGCYFLAIGDKGNSNLFLAAVGPSGGTDTNCPANVTPTTAEIVDSQTPVVLTGSNPISLVSTLIPGPNAGSIYVADAANNEVWEIDCSASNNPPVTCFVNQASPVALNGGATPTTMGISLPQSVGIATAAVLNQYLYVAGTSSAGPVLQYSNVGVNSGLFSFTASSLTVGNGPEGLVFAGPDPKDPPVTWFISASGGGANFQGSTWVMPTSGLLTILGSTIVDLSSPTPNLVLDFGTTAANGGFGSATIYCAAFGGGTGANNCPGTSGVDGANAVGGQSSTTSGGGGQGGQPTGLDLPASTVFTITLEACSEAAGCPASPNPATDTVLSQQISAGGVCTLTVTPTPPTALNNIAIGQTLNAQINCVAPASGVPPSGDNLTSTLTWKAGTTSTVNCTAQTCTLSAPVNGYLYENATLNFASNSYTAAGTYPIIISGTDTTEKVPIFFTGTLPTVTVNGPTISVNPAGSASNPTPVQLLGTQPFAGTLDFSASAPTVTWTLTADGVACSPGCGTITNTQATQITGTLDYNISASYNAPSGLVAGTIILTVTGAGASTQAFVATVPSSTNPPPACTLSSPPTSGQTGLAVTVTLTCTAPAGDSLSATVNWSDGEPQTMPGTADGTGTATITFTHTYANVGNYAVSVTSIQDTTTGFSGTPPAAFSVTVYQTPTVTPVQTTVSLAAGQSVTFGVSFAGGVSDAGITLSNFACQNLPTGASCAFSPSSITLDANGNSNNTLQLTVSLVAPPPLSGAAPVGSSQQILMASIWGLPLFGLVILGAVPGCKEQKRRRRVWCALLFILVIMLVLMWMPACSSVSQSNVACPSCPPPGTYPVTVTGSSVNPALQASTVFQLTVAQ
jgi:acylphosphatase